MITEERPITRANRAIVALNSLLEPHANEMYLLPPNPAPKHIDRMVDDLDALTAGVPEEDATPELLGRYRMARRALQNVRVVAASQRLPSGRHLT